MVHHQRASTWGDDCIATRVLRAPQTPLYYRDETIPVWMDTDGPNLVWNGVEWSLTTDEVVVLGARPDAMIVCSAPILPTSNAHFETGTSVTGPVTIDAPSGPISLDGETWPLPAGLPMFAWFGTAAADRPFRYRRWTALEEPLFAEARDILRPKSAFRYQNLSQPWPVPGSDAEASSLLNRLSFDLFPLPDANVVVLTRTYDAFHGRQRARVLLNGKEVGWWYVPAENRRQRLQTSRFCLPLPPEETEITVSIDPVPGTSLFSISTLGIQFWQT